MRRMMREIQIRVGKLETWHGEAISGAWIPGMDERYIQKSQLVLDDYAKTEDLQAARLDLQTFRKHVEKGVTDNYITKIDFDKFKVDTEHAVKTVASMAERVNLMEQEFQTNATKVLDT